MTGSKQIKEFSICVYCGSSPGRNEQYLLAAKDLGRLMAQLNIHLVYGGASIGIMGVLASEVLSNGGKVSGVMPTVIADREVTHTSLTRLYQVDTMHQRKAKMIELSDAVIALPGGIGTFEELFEALTWVQLGIHSKPCGILNVNNYYDKLLEFLRFSADEGFVKPEALDAIAVKSEPSELLNELLKG